MTVSQLWARASSPVGGRSSSLPPCRPGPRDPSSSLRGGRSVSFGVLAGKRPAPAPRSYARPPGRLKPNRPAQAGWRPRAPAASACAPGRRRSRSRSRRRRSPGGRGRRWRSDWRHWPGPPRAPRWARRLAGELAVAAGLAGGNGGAGPARRLAGRRCRRWRSPGGRGP